MTARMIFVNLPVKDLSDATRTTEVIVALSAESRSEVDELVATAVAAGATIAREPEDHGTMYGHGFRDLDGHLWELGCMDASG